MSTVIFCPDCITGICPRHTSVRVELPTSPILVPVTSPAFTPGTYYYGSGPHKCPVCDGSGLVSRPPHIAGDVATWSAGTATYPCKSCEGKGVLWS